MPEPVTMYRPGVEDPADVEVIDAATPQDVAAYRSLGFSSEVPEGFEASEAPKRRGRKPKDAGGGPAE